MKAKVEHLWIYSSTKSLEEYRPENEECFVLYLNVSVRPLDGEDSGISDYQLTVCNPEWVKQQCETLGSIWGRHTLIVANYNLDAIKKKVYEYIDGCDGADFNEVCQKIARIAFWEYEDFIVN